MNTLSRIHDRQRGRAASDRRIANMITNLFSIVYLSNATDNISESDLAELLAECQKNNGPNDITGLLVHYQQNFIQYLEGPEEDVKRLYQKIAQDPRHTGLIKMDERPAEVRTFKEWSMAFRSIGPDEARQICGEKDPAAALAEVLEIENPSIAAMFLKTCLQTMLDSK